MAFCVLQGCRGDDPFQSFLEYKSQLDTALQGAEKVTNVISNYGVGSLSLLCGKDLSSTVASLNILVANVKELSILADRVETLLDCERMNVVYVQTFDEGACSLAMQAAVWMLGILVFITVSGMVVFTLRSSLFHLRMRCQSDVDTPSLVDPEDAGDYAKAQAYDFDDYPLASHTDKSSESKHSHPGHPEYDYNVDEPVLTKRSWVQLQTSREVSIANQSSPNETDAYRQSSRPRSWETVTEVDNRSEADAAPPCLK